MKGLDGGDVLLIIAAWLSLLASLHHIEKAINRQSDLVAHAIVGLVK